MEYKEYENNTAVPDITAEPSASPEPDRALYDADISSTILEKLSAYYTEHFDRIEGDDYFIVRQSQYDYRLYFGDIAVDGSINDCTMVRYLGSGQYGAGYSLSVSELSAGTVDLSGYSGYIYSSYDTYLPSPYISRDKPSASAAIWTCVLSCIVICAVVGIVIRRWFDK